MKNAASLAFALLASIAIGTGGIPAPRAQTGGAGAYVLAETHVTEPAAFMQFLEREPAILATYHGRILARALPDVRGGARPTGW